MSASPDNFLDRYTIHRKNENSDDTVLRDKHSDNFVLMKELVMPTNEQFRKIVETLEAQRLLSHEHLLTLLEYYTMAEVGDDQLSYHKVVTFFQYSTHNLLEEIEVRYAQNRLFDESEVWSILCSSVLGLSYLQKESVGHGCISPIDIFIANDGTIRVVDPSIATSSPFVLQEGYYYSPEIMEYFRSPEEVSTEDLDIFKSDVFSLGMCVLHAALLESANDCFDYEQCTLDYELINSKLALFADHYPRELAELIASMLSEAPESRPDFIDLEEQLTAMTQSKQSSAKKSKGNICLAVACEPLCPDSEGQPSQLDWCPAINAIDSWTTDFNEDSTVKEESLKDFFTKHANHLVSYAAPVDIPSQPQKTAGEVLARMRTQPVYHQEVELPSPINHNVTQNSVNTSFNWNVQQTTPSPINAPSHTQEATSSFLGGPSFEQSSHRISTGVKKEPTPSEPVTVKKPLADCTPDHNTATPSTTMQPSAIKPFLPQSNSKNDSRSQDANITRTSHSKPEDTFELALQQQRQQAQQSTLQFRPPTNRTVQNLNHVQLQIQPAVVQQQTVTRILEIQQAPIAQVPLPYHPQMMRTSHHLHQIRPNEVVVSRAPVVSKQIVPPRPGVSPRNYIGYRKVGTDEHLFTDPSLLTMMRQDVQRILSKSQLKNKENLP